MAKLLRETLNASEKHARLTDFEFRIWAMLLPLTDGFGRFPASAAIVKGQAMPLSDVRPVDVEAALIKLDQVGLIHIYGVGPKRYLVYHDHDEHNPSKYLRNRRGRWPSPPTSLCACVSEGLGKKGEEVAERRGNDVGTTLEDVGTTWEGGVTACERRSKTITKTITKTNSTTPSNSSSSEEEVKEEKPNVSLADDFAEAMSAAGMPLEFSGKEAALEPNEVDRQLFQKALRCDIKAKPDTLRRYLRAWRVSAGAQYVDRVLSDPSIRGRAILWIDDAFFENRAKSATPPSKPRCAKCGGSGVLEINRGNGAEYVKCQEAAHG